MECVRLHLGVLLGMLAVLDLNASGRSPLAPLWRYIHEQLWSDRSAQPDHRRKPIS